ncbi:MAG: LUD domain-containing protein [Bacteroidales bacterium]
MNANESKFIEQANKVAFDKEHRQRLMFNISRYDEAVARGKAFYKNLELARIRAAYIRMKALLNLDKMLIDFELRIVSRGAKVLWAPDAEVAVNHVLNILQKAEIKEVVKSKSMASEELELNHELEKAGITPLETDLGEFIVQQRGEKPYHIVTPAMHLSKENIAQSMHEKFGIDPSATPEQITHWVRKHLREKFIAAEAGITGANFLIADPGAIALTENEGNGVFSLSAQKIHIVIAGIEKIIPSLEDLDLFWPLLAVHGTGQHLTVYNTIVTGPVQDSESEGPQEMYVILLNNGRTHVLAQNPQRRALTCIRCGACLNACPIYKNVGGYTYNATYTGPIGAVITPHMKGMEDYGHLSFASTLCGKCTEVCPVKIPLHEYLLYNRFAAVKSGHVDSKWKKGMKISQWALLKPSLLDAGKPWLRRWLFKKYVAPLWGKRRNLPPLPDAGFRKQWIKDNEKPD